MIRRLVLMVLAVASCAACSSSDTPGVAGKDPLGLPIYTLDGADLNHLELVANSNCPGGTRPYYKTIGGSGQGASVSYTCE